MSTKHLLADELQAISDLIPEIHFTADMLPSFRKAQAKATVMGDPQKFGVERREVLIPLAGQPDIRALMYVPKNHSNAAYLHFHGGGFIIGSPEGSDIPNLALAAKLGIIVLSVDYRLAPENPIPAPLDDAYAALAWLHQNATELEISTDKIAVGGDSAGGGLAAALAIHARDLNEYAICHQHLTFPMLDNLTGDKDHLGDPLVGEFVWNRKANQFGWQSYLGDQAAIAPQVPARLESYENLPPAWIHTVGLDLFRDENILFAQKLMQAGIAVELIVYPGACHGFQMIPNTQAGAAYIKASYQSLAKALRIET